MRHLRSAILWGCLFSLLVLVRQGLPAHRIGIRSIAGAAEFYDKQTGQRFVPRGANYLSLGLEGSSVTDQLFSPTHYDRSRIESALTHLRQLGYNTVRVFVDNCGNDCIGSATGGLSAPFLDNIADFLSLADQHGVYVILTSNDLPKQGGFVPRVESQCCSTFDGYINAQYLSPVGFAVYRDYWQDIVTDLAARGAPLNIVLAYALRNEQFFAGDQPPLSLTAGTVATADGKSYDMASSGDKQKMRDNGLIYWLMEIGNAIRTVDPQALFTAGFFAPDAPNLWRNDPRRVNLQPLLTSPAVDFLDIHMYPGPGGLSMHQDVENFGIAGFQDKPLLLGEFGGFKFVYRTPAAAAKGLQDWQVASCEYGFDGWLHWHWQGNNDIEVWTGSESGEAINLALSARARPDPCAATSFGFFENNVALHKPLSASRSLPDQPPAFANDGWMNTNWSSGAGPPQWLEIDLRGPTDITGIRLTVAQFPNGNTRHKIFGKEDTPGSQYQLLHTFRKFTDDGQAMEFTPASKWQNIRYVKIETRESPSWVAWREIEILSDTPTALQQMPPTAVAEFELRQNYPNPFNPRTVIVYHVKRQAPIEVSVFNLLGQRVATIAQGVRPPGLYSVVWDGKNALGEPVPSGVYLYRLLSPDFVSTKKLIVVR